MIYESKSSEIYQIINNQKKVRLESGREIFKFISKKYKTLPFAKRQLIKDFNQLKLSMGLLSLKKEGILHEFGILSEKRKNSLVSQSEHTVIIGEKITTKL